MNYSTLTMEECISLLSSGTLRLNELLSKQMVFTQEYDNCKEEIHRLTAEIERRKSSFLGIRGVEPDTKWEQPVR